MPHKILIIDDEINTVISLAYFVEQAGYLVDVARTGDEALAKIEQFAPDLILLDVMQPGVNGFDILHFVQQNSGARRIAVIVLIWRGHRVEGLKSIALGANAYLTKPFSTGELLTEIQDCLDKPQHFASITELWSPENPGE